MISEISKLCLLTKTKEPEGSDFLLLTIWQDAMDYYARYQHSVWERKRDAEKKYLIELVKTASLLSKAAAHDA